MSAGMEGTIDAVGRGSVRQRRLNARVAIAALVALLLALAATIWIVGAQSASPVSAAVADRVVRLVGRAPWFTDEMVRAQDSTISYAGMAPHAHVIAARITEDVVSLTVRQAAQPGARPAPIATVTLVSTAPAHGQSYALITMAQGPIANHVERDGAGYRVTFRQEWGRTPCAYQGPWRSTICRLPLLSHPYYWQLVYHVRGTSVSRGTFSTNYDGP